MCYTFNFGKHLVGDWASGRYLRDLSSTNTLDDCRATRSPGWRRTPDDGPKANKWIYFEQTRIRVGHGPRDSVFRCSTETAIRARPS